MIAMRMHPGLLEVLKARARAEGREMTRVHEQALAEYLAIPLAHPDLPPGPVELCAHCEAGVLDRGRCLNCGKWRKQYPKPSPYTLPPKASSNG